MKHWKEKDLLYILDKKYFPKCVECGGHYFHKEGCGSAPFSGRTEISKKQMSIINERLDKRLEEFEKKYGVNGCGVECENIGCANIATGKLHVLYHNTNKTAEELAVCMEHAYHEDSAGRVCQYRGNKA